MTTVGSPRWLVPISDRVPVGALPPQRLPGRLFVTVALDVATGDAADSVSVILTMYDPFVEFTRGSAAEGNAWGTRHSCNAPQNGGTCTACGVALGMA